MFSFDKITYFKNLNKEAFSLYNYDSTTEICNSYSLYTRNYVHWNSTTELDNNYIILRPIEHKELLAKYFQPILHNRHNQNE